MTRAFRLLPFLCLLAMVAAACGDDDPDATGGNGDGDDNAEEIITTVRLTFSNALGDPLVFVFDDPDGDGGADPTVDPIVLATDTTYGLSVAFENRLANPTEDITEEIRDEAEEHQVFVLGDAVAGPATDADADAALLVHSYADVESDYTDDLVDADLPVGLRNSIETGVAGSGELRLVLRHLPPANGEAVKTDGLAAEVADGGVSSIPGDSDVDIPFTVTVE